MNGAPMRRGEKPQCPRKEIPPAAQKSPTEKNGKSSFFSKPPKNFGHAPGKEQILGPPAPPHLTLKFALLTGGGQSSRPRHLCRRRCSLSLRPGGAVCTVDFPLKRGKPPAPKHLMAQVRRALMTKLGDAYLRNEILQFGMGIAPPRFPFWGESTSTPQPLAFLRVPA